MTQRTEEQRQAALKLIAEQVAIAKAALAKAEEIARENVVPFSFDVDGNYGYFEVYEYGGKVESYWDGWQGSNC